jgi:hypothetical protein
MAGIDPIAEAVKQRASGLYDDEHPVIHREPEQVKRPLSSKTSLRRMSFSSRWL